MGDDKTSLAEGAVRCRLHIRDYPIHWPLSPAMWECWVVGKLKEAGIPIEGTFIYRGIKSGTLVHFEDMTDCGAFIYEWTPDPGV